MSKYNDSLFTDVQNRNTQLWKRKNYLTHNTKIIRELNQNNSSSKLYCVNQKGELIKKPTYYLRNQFLYSKNKHIDLENLALKRVFKDQLFGLEICTNQQTFQIFGKRELIDEWYDYIKIYTIQSDFKSNYDMIKETGQGAYAKVFEVFNKKQGRIYAAKVFKKKNIHNYLGICKELQILRQLVHQNVIRLHEVYENSKHLYIILDYLAGGELLQAMISSEIYSEQTVKELIQNLLNALHYIHSNNILHRDIKPENLLLRGSQNIKDIVISDFGLSDEYNIKGDYMYPQCGTVGYIAPETFKNQSYDFKVDIFAVGVILFILFTDSNPFDGQETQEILLNNCQCKINFDLLKNQCISTNAYDFLMLLLQQNPELRPTAQQALQHDWFILPKMETQQYCQFSLKNIQRKQIIPKLKTKRRPKYWIVQQSPYKNHQSFSLSITGSSKSNNESDCASIKDDVLEQISMEETQPITQINLRSNQKSKNKLEKDDNLDDMCDDNFYENKQSPSSLVKIYHLSMKGIGQFNQDKNLLQK